jgi:hypothetical protein
MYPPSPSNPPSRLQRLLAAVLRPLLVIFGMLLMLGALLLGLVLATGVVLWALLRGRRPGPVNLRWGHMSRPRGFGRAPPRGEVVDVQAREVDGPTLR